MEHKRILYFNSIQQSQDFEICEFEGHIEISAYLSPEIVQVDIPANYHGKPVTSIGNSCFFGKSELKSVNIPDTITSIGAQAFALCKGLTEVTLPDSITEIGHHAFRDCRGIKKVTLPKNLKRISQGLFSFCNLYDAEIILPEGLETIDNGAFWSAGEFELKIPDSVKTIGKGAFYFGPKPITTLPLDENWFTAE